MSLSHHFALELKSDAQHERADESNSDGESDSERTPIPIAANPSSGLLLLAAVAEQKRLDEQSADRSFHSISMPMDMAGSSSSSCLSPTSSLVSRFSESVGFSPLCRTTFPATNLLLNFNYYSHPNRSTDISFNRTPHHLPNQLERVMFFAGESSSVR